MELDVLPGVPHSYQHISQQRGGIVTREDPRRHACNTFYACADGCVLATPHTWCRPWERGAWGRPYGETLSSPDKGSVECPTENICLTPPAPVCSLLCGPRRTVRSKDTGLSDGIPIQLELCWGGNFDDIPDKVLGLSRIYPLVKDYVQ